MRRIVLALLTMAVAVPVTAQTKVRGYTRADGTYVQPHHRSSPNSTRSDNWSTRGNVNPYTGKVGTRDPYAPSAIGDRDAGKPSAKSPFDPDDAR